MINDHYSKNQGYSVFIKNDESTIFFPIYSIYNYSKTKPCKPQSISCCNYHKYSTSISIKQKFNGKIFTKEYIEITSCRINGKTINIPIEKQNFASFEYFNEYMSELRKKINFELDDMIC
jgi:hypothetical protein